MKLEVGMYVRTDDGYIAKYDKSKHNCSGKYYGFASTIRDLRWEEYDDDCFLWESELKNIVKASYNIIDLIKAGDVVTFKNDEDVYRVSCVPNEESACDCFYLVFNYATQYGVEDIEVSKETMRNTLESIITREQFEQMAYKVGN